jgi:hypothetical protein
MIKKMLCIGAVVLLISILNSDIFSQQLAFPGAEGYGKYTTGGRGGRVIEVTTLYDRDRIGTPVKGSLREALATPGNDPITIVFRVSGIIKLMSNELKCSRSNITIAGQTAPGDGICIRYGGLKFSGNNIIIRYIRFRIGDEAKTSVSALGNENSKNIIIDHCSLSWSVEENHTCYDNRNTTVQWCIISEGLYNSYSSKGARSYGSQWGGQYASYHHNIIAHCNSRSPRINGCQNTDTVSLVDIRNNIIFNWGSSSAIYGGEYEAFYPDSATNVLLGAGSFTNFVNNYYKPGPASSGRNFAAPSKLRDGYPFAGYGKWYFSGNYMEGGSVTVNTYNWKAMNLGEVGDSANVKSDFEFPYADVTTQSASDAFSLLLTNAGATKPIRDSVDIRIIEELQGKRAVGASSTGPKNGIINSPKEIGGWPKYNTPDSTLIPADTDHDGMPDTWETVNGLNPNDSTDGSKITDDGYSNLEHYLNSDIPYIITTGIRAVTKEFKYFNIYPNPVKDKFLIESDQQVISIDIFDLTGKLILKKINLASNYISISSIEPGTYIVRATSKKGFSANAKIIIE